MPEIPAPPPWLTAGRSFYKAAFEKRTRSALNASLQDWLSLLPGEQLFVQAHLLYLNLLAQADQLALLEAIRDQLAEGQQFQETLIESLSQPPEETLDEGDFEEEALEEEDDGFDGEDDGEEEAEGEEDFFAEEEEPAEWEDPAPPQPSPRPAEPVILDVPFETVEERAEENPG